MFSCFLGLPHFLCLLLKYLGGVSSPSCEIAPFQKSGGNGQGTGTRWQSRGGESVLRFLLFNEARMSAGSFLSSGSFPDGNLPGVSFSGSDQSRS